MTDTRPARQPQQPPLAADLSPRDDRALDRTRQLAIAWQAGLDGRSGELLRRLPCDTPLVRTWDGSEPRGSDDG